MMRTVIIIFLLVSAISLRAGNCWVILYADVNNQEIYYSRFYPPDTTIVHLGWIGRCYVDNLSFRNYDSTHVNVYFQPGDTVDLSGLKVTQPGNYSVSFSTCYLDNSWIIYNYFTCSYLTDTLETYYENHFDHHYMDSLAAAVIAFNDSVK